MQNGSEVGLRRLPFLKLDKICMTNEPTETGFISRLRKGDEEAASLLWDRFFAQLMTLTRVRLQASSRAMSDEEDIVLSAMKSFCIGMRNGRFPELTNSESLWRLLLTITLRKIADKQNYDKRSKRDIAKLQSNNSGGNEQDGEVNALISLELDPEIAAECAEQIGRLMESLEHEDLKKVAIMKMEGYTNAEIAHDVTCSLTSIERKLRTIRSIWSQT